MNEALFKTTLVDWMSHAVGSPQIVTIDFDDDFVADNLIDGSVNGEALPQTAFDTDQATTLEALADQYRKISWFVLKAVVTGAHQITVTGAVNGEPLTLVGPTVTGGLAQAVATVTVTQDGEKINVDWADQNAPRLNYPYAVLRHGPYQMYGRDEFRTVDPVTKVATWVRQCRMTVTVDFFGKKPAPGDHSTLMEKAAQAHFSLSTQAIRDKFSAIGVAILQINPTQNLTGMLETIFEERARFEFYIGFAETREENVGYIETVKIDAQVNGEDLPTQIIGP